LTLLATLLLLAGLLLTALLLATLLLLTRLLLAAALLLTTLLLLAGLLIWILIHCFSSQHWFETPLRSLVSHGESQSTVSAFVPVFTLQQHPELRSDVRVPF
jgi:hypothetical protein